MTRLDRARQFLQLGANFAQRRTHDGRHLQRRLQLDGVTVAETVVVLVMILVVLRLVLVVHLVVLVLLVVAVEVAAALRVAAAAVGHVETGSCCTSRAVVQCVDHQRRRDGHELLLMLMLLVRQGDGTARTPTVSGNNSGVQCIAVHRLVVGVRHHRPNRSG